MSLARIKPLGLLFAATIVGGCATVPREAGFPDVERDVAERTGGKRVHWNQGTASDQAVTETVRTMLQRELTADEAVQVALLNNRNLQATYEDLMVAQADLVAAGLLRNPVFDAEFRFSSEGTGMELSLLQDFVDIFYIPLRKRLAGAAFEAAKLRVTGAVLDLAGETRAAYFELQSAQQRLELRRQVAAATGASFDLAQRLRQAGNNTELDLINERTLYEQSKVNVGAAEAEVARAREELNTLMGLWGGQTEWTIAPRLPDLPEREIAAAGLERRAVERSLDLGAARQEVRVAAAGLGIVDPFGPFADAAAGVTDEHEPGGDIAIGPGFSIPLPLFNQGQPAVATAQAQLRAAERRFEASAIALRAKVRSAYAALTDARDRASYYRHVLLPLRQRAVDLTQLQYNAMQVGAFQLLLAKQQQIESAEQYIQTLQEYWLARAALDQILAGRAPSFTQTSVPRTSIPGTSASGSGGH